MKIGCRSRSDKVPTTRVEAPCRKVAPASRSSHAPVPFGSIDYFLRAGSAAAAAPELLKYLKNSEFGSMTTTSLWFLKLAR